MNRRSVVKLLAVLLVPIQLARRWLQAPEIICGQSLHGDIEVHRNTTFRRCTFHQTKWFNARKPSIIRVENGAFYFDGEWSIGLRADGICRSELFLDGSSMTSFERVDAMKEST